MLLPQTDIGAIFDIFPTKGYLTSLMRKMKEIYRATSIGEDTKPKPLFFGLA